MKVESIQETLSACIQLRYINNIVKMSKDLMNEFDKSLKEDLSDQGNIIERLSKLSETMIQESKNASHYDNETTTKIFKELAEFFKSDDNTAKITQYELYKSKLVDALHSYLSLPIKEEESKSSNNQNEKSSNDTKTNDYNVILLRYMCMIEVFWGDEVENDQSESLQDSSANKLFSVSVLFRFLVYKNCINKCLMNRFA